MAIIEFSDFAFAYAGAAGGAVPGVGPISFAVEEGAFCLLTGPTGCGKTTLLRACKPELAPHGSYTGTLDVCGARLVENGRLTGAMDQAFSASRIGFVMQDPDAQIVCDTVWHELAFALENLGFDEDAMRRRVAEVAHYLGIAPWIGHRSEELSGGQKQLVNLAAVLVLRPPLILLDEPTAQLDPAAHRQFSALLASVRRELGLTVVVATHASDEMSVYATQIVECPCENEREDQVPASGNRGERSAHASEGPVSGERAEAVVRVRDAFVRFESNGPWVLRGLDLNVRAGTVHALVGGNGSGKTTLLRMISGELKPRRGKVRNGLAGAQAYLPQDPKAVFVCDSVAEELREWQGRVRYSDRDIAEIAARFGLSDLGERHPYDLSGGQRQNLAFAKMLLCRPRLLLLDEPTKGLDACARAKMVRVLRALADEGATIVVATHDLDMVDAAADEVTLLFDGCAACTQPVARFFEDNLIWRPGPE